MDDSRYRKLTRVEFERLRENVAQQAEHGIPARRKAAATMQAELDTLSHAALIEIMFRGVKLSPRQQRLIEVLDENPGQTVPELTAALGWRAQSWLALFAALCRDRLGPAFPVPETPEGATNAERDDSYARILADFGTDHDGVTLREDAREALVAAGILSAR